MASLDIFNDNAFNVVSMTRAVQRVPYVPSYLGSLNLFEVDRIRTDFAGIERSDGRVKLIPTTERGGPPVIGAAEGRDLVPIRTPRLAKRQRQQAQSIQNVRAFGTESELAGVQDEVLKIQARLRRDLDLTMEFHRLGAIQGKLLDADGNLLLDMYQAFGVAEPALIDFDLDTPTTDVPAKARGVVRAMRTASRGTITASSRIIGLCGDEFFDKLIRHESVKETYRAQQGSVLRERTIYDSVTIGGIEFVNYQGTDDGSTIAIQSNGCRFFPVGAPGAFGLAYSPLESADYVNTPGQDFYAMVIWDQERRFWWQPEIYSYPLHFCTVPEMLLRAIADA